MTAFSYEEASTPAADAGGGFSYEDAATPAPKAKQPAAKTLMGDYGRAVKQGALQLPGQLAGLADIPAGYAGLDRPVSKAADAVGRMTGFTPGAWAKDVNAEMSPATQAARADIDATWADPNTGAADVAAAYARNPRQIGLIAAQSLPAMAVGGLAGRAALAAAPGLGAAAGAGIGEGAMMAGQAMSEIDPSVDPRIAAAAATGIGVAGGVIGGAASKLMGPLDPDLLMMGRAAAGRSAAPMWQRVPAAAAKEGLLEEAPQSAIETAGKNWAEDKPLTEGMARNVVEGTLAGSALGGAAGALPQGQQQPAAAPPPAIDPNAGPVSRAASLLALPAPGTLTPGATLQADQEGNVGAPHQFDQQRAPRPIAETGAMGQGRQPVDESPSSSPEVVQSAPQPSAGAAPAPAALDDTAAAPGQAPAADGKEASAPMPTTPPAAPTPIPGPVQNAAARLAAPPAPQPAAPTGTGDAFDASRQGAAVAPVTPAGAAAAPAVHRRDDMDRRARIDLAAQEGATSRYNDRSEPTDGQKKAGNYPKGHLPPADVHGLRISVENPRDSVRSGTDPDGSTWNNTMPDHYGHILGTKGADGDQLDIYVGPGGDQEVFVVDQVDQRTGNFDEHKIMLDYGDEAEALDAYRRAFADGWKVGKVTRMSVDQFKEWIKGDTTKALHPETPVGDSGRLEGDSRDDTGPTRYGRNGQRLDQGGKPFGGKLGARQQQKNQPGTRIVKVPGGFALQDPSDREIAARAANAKTRLAGARSAAWDKNPFMAWLADKGLFHAAGAGNSLKAEFSPDRQIMVSGHPPMFRRTGLQLDDLLVRAIEDGFMPQGATERDLYEQIARAIRGERIAPLYGQDAEQHLQQRMDQQQERQQDQDPFGYAEALRQDETDPFDPHDIGLTDDDLAQAGYFDATPQQQHEFRAILAAAQAAGVDVDTILEDAATLTQDATDPDQAYHAAALEAIQQALQPAPEQRGDADGGGRAGQRGDAQGQAGDRPAAAPAAGQADAAGPVAPDTAGAAPSQDGEVSTAPPPPRETAPGDQEAPPAGGRRTDWRDEGKSTADLMADRVDGLGRDLAGILYEESREQDFKPSEVPDVIRMWAGDHKVAADDLRVAVLRHVGKSDLSDGRKRQIRDALNPIKQADREAKAKPPAPSTTPAAPQDLLGAAPNASQQAANRERAEREARQRRQQQAAPDADGFTLTGSTSTRDEGAAAGQRDMLDEVTNSAPPAAPSPQPAPPPSAAPAPASGGSSRESRKKPAVSPNKVFTEDAAAAARARLKAKLGRPMSGIDPEMLVDGITLAGYHIERGARTFAAYAAAMLADLGEGVRPYLKSWYMAAKYDPRAAAFSKDMSSPGFVDEFDIATVQASPSAESNEEEPEPNDVPSSSPTVEPAGGQPADQRPVAPGDGGQPGRDGAPAGETGNGGRAPRSRQPGGASVPAGGAAAGGERGDQRVDRGDGPARPEKPDAGNPFGDGSGESGIVGLPPEPEPAAGAGTPAEGGSAGSRQTDPAAAQRRAQRVAVKPGDLENIRESLPYLLPEQQQDVFKAEQRFAKPDGYGMLFTNGTGTGKTFSGLGIVKRFERQGKTNVLIVVPDEKIANDWIESGEPLRLKLTKLPDTKTAGAGIVVTTYANLGLNDELAKRDWDLVVADEAHTLMQDSAGTVTSYLQNFRAITLHPDGAAQRFVMRNREDYDRAASLRRERDGLQRDHGNPDATEMARASIQSKLDAIERELSPLQEKLARLVGDVRADVVKRQGAARPRAVFLSATPWAYHATLDWSNGYLFDYRDGYPDPAPTGYNAPSPQQWFFINRLGYRMRTGKLTKPDAKVDQALMERQLNTQLKKSGSVSGRMLEVEPDYDRRFVLIESAIGNKIDEALQFLTDKVNDEHQAAADAKKADPAAQQGPTPWASLRSAISQQFDYLQRRYLLEAIKAREAVPVVRKHLELGRKVVVFHDYKKGGAANPFDVDAARMPKDTTGIPPGEMQLQQAKVAAFNAANAEFRRAFPQLLTELQKLESPIDVFTREFPGVLRINADEKHRDVLARYKTIQSDQSGPVVALVQSAKNKGWSGHDTTGKHQRVLLNLGQPTQPTMSIQQEGRIYRTGVKTDAIVRLMNTGTNWERRTFAEAIAQRTSTVENLGMGEQARALMDSYVEAFENSDAYPPGHEGEGKGGKDRDRLRNQALSEFDRAKAFYFGQQKKTSKTKAQEGADYFATPEPVGLKMVEWASIHPGEAVLEPSAGHGAIARWIRSDATRTAIEPSRTLGPRLQLVFDGKVIEGTFEDHHTGANKYDAIVMNPPFGVGGKLAMEHVRKAVDHLRDGGRIVALIPTGPAADKRLESFLEGEETRPAQPLGTVSRGGDYFIGDTVTLDSRDGRFKIVGVTDHGVQFEGADGARFVNRSHYIASVKAGPRTETFKPGGDLSLVADIKLPQVTFERASTAVATRILVLEKQGTTHLQHGTIRRDLSDVDDIGALFDRIEDMAVPARPAPAEDAKQDADSKFANAKVPVPAALQRPAAAPAAAARKDLVTVTTNSGKKLRGIIRTDLTKAQAQAIDLYTWKPRGYDGYFIREKYLKDDEPPPAFAQRQNSAAVDVALDNLTRSDLEDGEIFARPLPAEDDDGLTHVRGLGRDAQLSVRGDGVRAAGPHEFFMHHNDGTPIGYVRLTKNAKRATISMIAIQEEYRGNGYAKAFYEFLLNDLGLDVRSDSEITDGTATVYRSLLKDHAGEVDADGRVILKAGKVAFAQRPNTWNEREDRSFREDAMSVMYRRLSNIYDRDSSTDEAFELAMEASSPAEKSLLRSLKTEDLLGFDYPHQALRALIEEPESYDISPTLKAAITRLSNAPRDPMFAQRVGGRGGAQAAMLQESIDGYTAKWANKPTIRVVADINDVAVPAAIKAEGARAMQAGGGVPVAVYFRGETWIFADQVEGDTDLNAQRMALEAMFHEVLGHHGLRGRFGPDLDRVLRQVQNLRRADVREMIQRTGMDPADPLTELRAAEEVLAYLAQTKPTIALVQRAIAAIRTWLRENLPTLFKGLALSDAELIRNFILPARGWVERGAAAASQPDGEPAMARVRPLRPTSPEDRLAALGYRVQSGYEDEGLWIEDMEGTQFTWNDDSVRFQDEDGNPLPEDAAAIAQYIGNVAEGVEDPEAAGGAANDRNVNPFGASFTQGRQVQVDGVWRPIDNSEGQPIHPTHAGQVEFWKWFGDSKVVDDNGRPIVQFHGTNKDIKAFKDGHPVYFGNAALAGMFVAGGRRNAGKAGARGASIYPVYLRITNPFDVTAMVGVGTEMMSFRRMMELAKAPSDDAALTEMARRDLQSGMRGVAASMGDPVAYIVEEMKKPTMLAHMAVDHPDFIAALRKAGYDGLKWRESITKGVRNPVKVSSRTWAVFDANQIKSTTGNSGAFDPGNDDIRFMQRNHFGTLDAAQEAALRNVGGIVQPKTLAQRMGELRQNLGLRIRQGVFDQFAPIKDVDPRAYMMARMSKGAEGTMEAALLYGKPFLRDGVPDVDIRDGGFAKVLASLQGEHDRFAWWVAAQRAERLKAAGKENLFTGDDISALKTLDVGTLPDGRTDRAAAYKAALQGLNEFNDAVLQVAEESGLIDPEARSLFKDQPYVPFYRVMEDEAFDGPKFSAGLVNQQAWKKLKGGKDKLNQDLLQNMLLNWSHLYTASARNRAAIAALDAAEALAIAHPAANGAKDAVKVMRGGVAHRYVIEDPYLMEAVTALNYTPSPLMKPLAKAKQILTFGVTANPMFKVRNLLRDSIAAMAQADLSYNPFKNVAQGWKESKHSQVYASMLAAGGVMKFGSQENSERVRAQLAKMGGRQLDETSLETMRRQMLTLWDAYQDIGDRGENVNRIALYKQLRAKGVDHAEASYMARDLMDFAMSGKWPVVRFLVQTVPFLNARLQGLAKLERAGRENPKRMAIVVMAVMVASLALWAHGSDDDDWKRRPEHDRDLNWWLKIGDMAFRIPKPFELGLAGSLAERTAELFFDKEMTGERFLDRLAFMATQVLSLNPVPQLFSPLFDVYSNRDSFRRTPIENVSDQRLRPQDRYDERTSETARFLGQLGLPEPVAMVKGDYNPLSPKQWDFLLNGYFSWMGGLVVGLVDIMARPALGRGERPDWKMRGMAEELPAGGSRYVSAFYEQARDIEQAWASYQDAVRDGDQERAADILATGKPRNRIAAGRVREGLARLTAQAKRIEANQGLSGEEKRTRLDEIDQRRHELARRFMVRE